MLSSLLFHAAALLSFLSTPSIAAPLSKRSIAGPVIQANFPDPSIIQVGSTYYAFATNNGAQHIPWASSPDFNSWTVAAGQDALPTVGAWSNGNNVWAPDVIQLRQNSSRFVMYYTANTADGATHCLGAAVSSNVEGPYSPLPDTLGDCPRSQGGAIDPAGFIDSDGNIYVVYKIDGNSVGHGGNCNNGNDPIVPTPIMIQPMEADGVTPRGGPTQILDRSDADGPLVEAPSLVRSSEGVYVLFFSSNCFDGPYYDTSYATASNVMGPYTKTQKPLLVPGSGNNLYSPGGTDVLSDGKKIVFHADQGTSANTRQMYIGEISISGTTVTI